MLVGFLRRAASTPPRRPARPQRGGQDGRKRGLYVLATGPSVDHDRLMPPSATGDDHRSTEASPTHDATLAGLSKPPTPTSMRDLAFVRIVLGAFAWLAPRAMNRIFGVPRADDSPALIYMNRVFGVRAVSLGVGYLVSSGEARQVWHRLWLLCDGADTVMGAAMVARGELRGLTAAQSLAVTAGAA